jgi:hypothetical protein
MAKLAMGAVSANQLQFSLNPPPSSNYVGKFLPPQPIVIDKFRASGMMLPAMVSFLLNKLEKFDDKCYCLLI